MPSLDNQFRFRRRRLLLLRDGFSVAALVFLAWAWIFLLDYVARGGIALSAIDAHAYWSVDLAHLYRGAVVGDLDAFLYSPAAGQALAPLTVLPWPIFYALWTGLLLGCLVYLCGPILSALLLLAPPVWADIGTGNIHLMMAVAIVLGFRYSATWALVLLTKITPGIGIAWFGVRREWRRLGIALGGTALIALASFVIAPQLWSEWWQALATNSTAAPRLLDLPLYLRLPIALLIVVVGAITGWRWTVPVAATAALPVLWLNGLTLLLGALPLIDSAWLRSIRAWPWAAGWSSRAAAAA